MSGRRPTLDPTQMRAPAQRLRLQLGNLAADAGLATHILLALTFGALGLIFGVVATTLLVLGPRWLGVIAAAVTLLAVLATAVEVRRLMRKAQMRYWRRRHVVISGEGDETEVR